MAKKKGGNGLNTSTTATLNELREAVQGREFESLEEVEAFVDALTDRKNREPVPIFLGFSPDQMHRMLHFTFEDTADIIRFNVSLPPEVFWPIPVVKNVLIFLSRLSELEPLKSTAKGNLPLKFARELHGQSVQREKRFHILIRSEEDSIHVHSLRHILVMCGWIKKHKGHFGLTGKGRKLVGNGFSGEHYLHLLKIYARKFNWGFQDLYPELWIIQGSFLFCLYLLREKAKEFIEDVTLANYFIDAFPTALTETEEEPYWEPQETVTRAFSIRFLERFCEYFGLVETRREEIGPYKERLFVKTSDFFKEFLLWKGP